MNRFNPNKLLLSKWTAVSPKHREKHFVVSKLIRDENEVVIGCELEAVINKKIYRIDWQELKHTEQWLMG